MPQSLRTFTAPVHYFDVRGIDKHFRHASLFGALNILHPGEVMPFVNDHDPLPLLHQVRAHYGDRLRFEYVKRQPALVEIDFFKADMDADWEGGAP